MQFVLIGEKNDLSEQLSHSKFNMRYEQKTQKTKL